MLPRKVFKTSLLILAWMFCQSAAFAHAKLHKLPKDVRVPGGIAVLRLRHPSYKMPTVLFNDERVMVRAIPHAGRWAAVIGIPLTAHPGRHTIRVLQPNREYRQFFIVKGQPQKNQRLHIRNKRKVDPNNQDIRRIVRERQRITRIHTQTHNNFAREADIRLVWPVRGPVSASFGLKRILNGKPKNTHSGLDIAAPAGRPIRVASGGRVVGVENLFFTGKTVFVTHGQGFMTVYCHMSKTLVHRGQRVKKGDIIGRVGMTGRVTGPHLHFITMLNQTKVNPKLLLPPSKRSKVRHIVKKHASHRQQKR